VNKIVLKNIGKYLFKIRCNGRIKLVQDTMQKVMGEQKLQKERNWREE
jgi:hypothetical protein